MKASKAQENLKQIEEVFERSLLQLFTDKLSILNEEWQSFQRRLKLLIEPNEATSSLWPELEIMCNTHSVVLTQLQIQYLAKCKEIMAKRRPIILAAHREWYEEVTSTVHVSKDLDERNHTSSSPVSAGHRPPSRRETHLCPNADCKQEFSTKANLQQHINTSHDHQVEDEQSDREPKGKQIVKSANSDDDEHATDPPTHRRRWSSMLFSSDEDEGDEQEQQPPPVKHQELDLQPEAARSPLVNSKAATAKQWKCHYENCTSSFPERKYLFKHIRKKHNGKPYECSKCGEEFAYDRQHRDHIKTCEKTRDETLSKRKKRKLRVTLCPVCGEPDDGQGMIDCDYCDEDENRWYHYKCAGVTYEQALRMQEWQCDACKNAKYCICRKPDDGRGLVQCDQCDEWFHYKCVGIDAETAEKTTQWLCLYCKKPPKERGDEQDVGRYSPLRKRAKRSRN